MPARAGKGAADGFRTRRRTSNCAGRGCPSPGPAPFVPHGEGRTWPIDRTLTTCIELRPPAPPSPDLSPPNCRGERGTSVPLRLASHCAREGPSPARLGSHPLPQAGEGINVDPASTRCIAPPSPAQFAGEGRGGGRPPSRSNPAEALQTRPHTPPPPALLGEVGRWCRPGGGVRGAVRSAPQPVPCIPPPARFAGGGGALSGAAGGGSRRGRATFARPRFPVPFPGTEPAARTAPAGRCTERVRRGPGAPNADFRRQA